MTHANAAGPCERHALVGRSELWKLKRDFQAAFLMRMGLEPHHFLLDVGCGTLRGGLPLIAALEPGHYFGIEAREEALAEARKEVTENGLARKTPVLIRSADFASLVLPQQFQFIWAFSLLFHLTEALLSDCFLFVRRHLAPGGRFFANVLLGDGLPGEWLDFPVVYRTENLYASCAERVGLDTQNIGTLRDLGHHSGIAEQDDQVMLQFS